MYIHFESVKRTPKESYVNTWSKVTGYSLGDWGSIFGKTSEFPVHHHVQTCFGAHLAYNSTNYETGVGGGDISTGVKQSLLEGNHFNLLPRSKTCGGFTVTPPILLRDGEFRLWEKLIFTLETVSLSVRFYNFIILICRSCWNPALEGFIQTSNYSDLTSGKRSLRSTLLREVQGNIHPPFFLSVTSIFFLSSFIHTRCLQRRFMKEKQALPACSCNITFSQQTRVTEM